MDPEIMPMQSTNPPLDDSLKVGAEEDEFGDFGNFSVGMCSSTKTFTHFTEPPPSLRQPCPDTHQPSSSFNNPIAQSQPPSTVTSGIGRCQTDIKGKHCNADRPLHLTNGYPESHHPSEPSDCGSSTASVLGAGQLREESGFADFAAFAEQAVHPWCCGFSPLGIGEHWDGSVTGSSLGSRMGESQCNSGQDIDMHVQPGSYRVEVKDCTKIKHCVHRSAAPVQLSQDQHIAAALSVPSEELHPEDKDVHDPWVLQRERKSSLTVNTDPLQTKQTEVGVEKGGEDGKGSVSPFAHTRSESVSEDFTLFCDVVLPEGIQEDCVHNLSFANSQEENTDELRSGTGGEEEHQEKVTRDVDNFGQTSSITTHDFANHNSSQCKVEKEVSHFDQAKQMVQETSPEPNQSETRIDVEETVTDITETSFGEQGDPGNDQSHVAGQCVGILPPSDSFADFCSAPTHGEAEGCWEEFSDPRTLTEGNVLTKFGETDIDKNTEGDTKETHRGQGDAAFRRDGWQAPLSSCVQKLFLTTFPEVVTPVVEDEQVPSLCSVLQTSTNQSEKGHGEMTEEQLCPMGSWVQWNVWQHPPDVHDFVGLKFQWGGSHSSRILLRYLDMDTRNIGGPEPTKDSTVSPVRSPGRAEMIKTKGHRRSNIRQDSSPDPAQGLPAVRVDCSSGGARYSQAYMSPRRAPHFWGWK